MKICWSEFAKSFNENFIEYLKEPLIELTYTPCVPTKEDLIKFSEEWNKPLPDKLESIFDYSC